jgi:3-dehydroquinate synthase
MKITQPKFLQSANSLCKALDKQLAGRRYVLLTDEMVSKYCVPHLTGFLSDFQPLDIVEVEAGESGKAAEVCFQLWSHLLDLGVGKKDVLICLGGGSISDLGGFIAATYKRGISCIFIPTTLLAMTDASIGGKNGIDVDSVKNAVGTIVQPEAIFIFPRFCESLEHRQFLSGMAEIFKHGVIEGGEFWKSLETLPCDEYDLNINLLKHSVRTKLNVVRKDVHESSLRKILNFGHTIGHAIESAMLVSGKTIEHGIAVAAGMLVESHFAYSSGLLNQQDFNAINELISKWYAQSFPNLPTWDEVFVFMKHDKKVDVKKNALYLPVFLGQFKIFEISGLDEMKLSYNEIFKSYLG